MAVVDETKSLEEIRKFLADLVESILGLPQNKVLLQYRAEGQPMPKFGENIVFVNVQPELDERDIYKVREEKYNTENDNFEYAQKSQRTLLAQFVLYGDKSSEYAKLLNESIYFPNYEYMINNFGLYLVPDRTIGPNYIPELLNGRWWSRADLQIRFYNPVSVKTTVERIKDITITVETEGGQIEYITE